MEGANLRRQICRVVELIELLSWLRITDLESRSSDEVLRVLDEVLEAYPESREVSELEESLLAEVEEASEYEEPDLALLKGLPERYAELGPRADSPLEEVERRLGELAESLTPEQIATARLLGFSELLATLSERDPDEVRGALDDLERSLESAWSHYSEGRFSEDEVSAQAVAGHRFLKSGFQCWFEALEAARRGDVEGAVESASRGNRLLTAVSLWSDSLPRDASLTMGEG